MPRPSERRNITQPPDWWLAWEQAAADSGRSLSEWIGDACNASLPSGIAESLSERRGPGRVKTVESGESSS